MKHFEYSIELLASGTYKGNKIWNKSHTEIDNCFKIYYITKGNLFIEDKNQTHKLQASNLYFINGNKLKNQYCENTFETIWLHFSVKNIVILNYLMTLKTVNQITIFEENPFSCIINIINNQKLDFYHYYYQSYKLQNIIQSIVINLMEKNNFENEEINPIFEQLQPAINFIEQNYTMEINLKDLAALCSFSPNHFHKLFKQFLHITPIQYINQKKMNASLSLLLNNQLSIKEIAFELGYCNIAYFCRSFKNYYDMSPKKYRQEHNELMP